jgi:hypothetical protein
LQVLEEIACQMLLAGVEVKLEEQERRMDQAQTQHLLFQVQVDVRKMVQGLDATERRERRGLVAGSS